MSKHASTEARLGHLHQRVTERLIEEIDRTHITEINEEGAEVQKEVPLSVGILNAAVSFLKANEITCNEDTSAVSELSEKLAAKRRRRVGNVVQLHEEDID